MIRKVGDANSGKLVKPVLGDPSTGWVVDPETEEKFRRLLAETDPKDWVQWEYAVVLPEDAK